VSRTSAQAVVGELAPISLGLALPQWRANGAGRLPIHTLRVSALQAIGDTFDRTQADRWSDEPMNGDQGKKKQAPRNAALYARRTTTPCASQLNRQLNLDMEKHVGLLLLASVLLLLLPLALHAETLRCKAEVRKLCDLELSCESPAAPGPLTEYLIELPRDMNTVKAIQIVAGKKVRTWSGHLDTETESAEGLRYVGRNGSAERLTLSRSMATFIFLSATKTDREPVTQKEVGLCSLVPR
jgi:hypothetical protein